MEAKTALTLKDYLKPYCDSITVVDEKGVRIGIGSTFELRLRIPEELQEREVVDYKFRKLCGKHNYDRTVVIAAQ